MARTSLQDYLQQYRFHLFDVPQLGGAGNILRSDAVFTLVGGFTTITNPELTVEAETIQEGTFAFSRFFTKRASVGPILLTKGVRTWDNLFWDWASSQVVGGSPKRTMFLVQFTRINPLAFVPGAQFVATKARASKTPSRSPNPVGDFAVQAVSGDFLMRIPGRSWTLYNCVPTRYKSGSDLDARSSEISVEELELQPEFFEEVSLSGRALRRPSG